MAAVNNYPVTIEIHYTSNDINIMQGGTFPLRRRTHEQAALDFWKQIRRSMPYGGILQKVICNGEDITDKVIPLDIIEE